MGHFALGYVAARASSKILGTEPNLPLVFMLSIIPDIDLLFPSVIHRGPTHSIVLAAAIFTPVFATQGKKAIPYFLALVQHSLVADYITGGRIQLFWPVMTTFFGTSLSIRSQVNIVLESSAFILSLVLMMSFRDIGRQLEPYLSNLILIIPAFSVLLPIVLSFPLEIPLLLLPTHAFYAVLFALAMTATLSRSSQRNRTA